MFATALAITELQTAKTTSDHTTPKNNYHINVPSQPTLNTQLESTFYWVPQKHGHCGPKRYKIFHEVVRLDLSKLINILLSLRVKLCKKLLAICKVTSNKTAAFLTNSKHQLRNSELIHRKRNLRKWIFMLRTTSRGVYKLLHRQFINNYHINVHTYTHTYLLAAGIA